MSYRHDEPVQWWPLVVALILIAVSLIFAPPVEAQQRRPMAGDTVPVRGTILCDTQEQIEDILTAHQESFEAGKQAATRYARLPNERGEPSCAFLNTPALLSLGESVNHFEDVYGPRQTLHELWVIPVIYQTRSGESVVGFIFAMWNTKLGQDT